VKVNRIWSYLVFGFGAITGLYYLFNALLIFMYGTALENGQAGSFSMLLVSLVNLALATVIGLVIYHKRSIAAYLQSNLRRQPLLMVVNAVILLTIANAAQKAALLVNVGSESIFYMAVYSFKSPFVTYTFFLLLAMLAFGIISLFFTVRYPENSSWKDVF